MEENNKLIINSKQSNLLNELKKNLKECERFYFSVAFINYSGLQLLLDTLKELETKNIKGKIITTTYLNFTEPKALEKLQELSEDYNNFTMLNDGNKGNVKFIMIMDSIKKEEDSKQDIILDDKHK